ncbi:coiled-coil domain-containing protein [Bacillus ndiopicus]|uniref:coiled-coil domain-containing protein n=1 Tax=Bacillus ndiopicus TaxID=1347368 RepID=UPI0005A9D402|nr:hypothetical protein [Bacillus ndiopicus]
MNKLIFKSLYIIDRQKKLSYYTTFHSRINVITSSEVSLGKSTILKSLYYTLGAELQFGELPIKNLITIVTFTYMKNDYLIVRNGSYFLFNHKEKNTLYTSNSEFKEAMISLLGYEITIEKNEKIYTAPPVFYFIPYYIDQINGWTVNPQSFLNLGQFTKVERDDMIYYHLGIYGENYSSLLSEKNELEYNIKNDSNNMEKNKELSNLLQEEMDNLVEISDTDSLFFRKIKTEYENEGNIINKIKMEILILLNERATTRRTIDNLQKVIKSKNKEKNILKENSIQCPHCNEIFSPTDKEIFDANIIIVDVDSEIADLNKIILTLNNKIEAKEQILKKHIDKIKHLEQLKSKQQVSFESMAKSKGIAETRHSLLNKILKYENDILVNNVTLKSVKKKIKEINKQKEGADNLYTTYYKKYLSSFLLYNEPMMQYEKILPKETFSSTGAVQVLLNLIRFYATIELINHFKFSPLLPIVIDSPKSGEQSFSNNQLIIENLTSHFNVSNQRIIATIDFKKSEDTKNIKIIELTNEPKQLLSKESFIVNQKEINRLIQIFDKSLNDSAN